MRLGKNSKAAAISRVPLFSRCSKRQLIEIAQLADEIDLPAGHTLTKEGTSGREFFVILEGSAEVRRDGRVIASLCGGDFLGEIALVTDVPRTATVTATTPVRVLVVPTREFRQLLRTSPDIQGKVLEAVAERVAGMISS
jgi:CRP/FNR family transcriptional regulator, cyclic AMP receptor protein